MFKVARGANSRIRSRGWPLGLKRDSGGGAPIYTPSFAIADGSVHRYLDNAGQTNAATFGLYMALKDTNTLSSQIHGLFSVWGRLEIKILANGKLWIGAERGFDDFIFVWESTSSIKAAGVSRLVISLDLSTSAGVSVWINETPVAGSLTTNTWASGNLLVFNRSAFSLCAIAQGEAGTSSEKAAGLKISDTHITFGATYTPSMFYAADSYIDPASVGTPHIRIAGASGWISGANPGSLGDFALDRIDVLAAASNVFFEEASTPNEPVLVGTIDSSDTVVTGSTTYSFDLKPLFLGYNVSFSQSGLPGWASLSNGVISGTAGAAGDSAVTVTATNAGGSVALSFTLSVIAVATAPAQFTTGQWTLVNAEDPAGDKLTLTVLSRPADGGSPITDLQYQIGAGSWTSVGSALAGVYTITGTENTEATVGVRAVNAVGNGTGSATKAATPTKPAWTPTWVDNGGTAYLTTDSTVFGTDGANFEALLLLRGLEGLAASISFLWENNGRSELWFSSTQKLSIILRDTANVTLVNWEATNAFGAGEWLIHMRAELSGTPLFEVYALNLLDAVPAWAQVAGTFNTGPLTGTIDLARTSTAVDHTILTGLASNAATAQIANLEAACILINLNGAATPQGRNAFYSAGVLRDPSVVLPGASILFEGAATVWNAGTNSGTGTATWTVTGTFTDGSGGGGGPADPLDALNPFPMVGFGAATTGGQGGKVVRVTSTADSAATVGSFRWALTQHPGEPLYIALCVEGYCYSSTARKITRPNVTIDGRFAPGIGFIFTGGRFEIEASNIMRIGVQHYGSWTQEYNNGDNNNNGDNSRIGKYSSDPASTIVVENIYDYRCAFLHCVDEGWTIYTRSDDQTTGAVVRNVTLDSSLVGRGTGTALQPTHDFCLFIGSGGQKVTVVNNAFMSSGRMPFVKANVDDLEFFNNAWTGANENWSQFVGAAEARFQGNVLALSDVWTNVRAPLLLGTGTKVYANDNTITSFVGETNSYGLTRGPAPVGSPTFTASMTPAAASTVVAKVTESNVGAPRYGGGVNSHEDAFLTEWLAGTYDRPSYPVTLPTVTGASYPANTNGVPDAYLTTFPDDTDLEATITTGDWAGQMVAARVGAWLASAHNA